MNFMGERGHAVRDLALSINLIASEMSQGNGN